ncbi:MAG: preprotein translocase subunit SecE [Actinomycetota bacterium]
MAKTRAQRKAERRAREAQQQRQGEQAGRDQASAQHDTQVPVSGDVAEVKAVEVGIAAGAPERALETPDAPKPKRAERRAEEKRRKDVEKRAREDEKRQERERLARKQKQAAAEERQRGRVFGFLASCWAELKKVQWPDRETLIQASAVTLVFVAIAAAYLGALDAAFNFLIKRIL